MLRKMTLRILLAAALAVAVARASVAPETLEVECKQGKVEGVKEVIDDSHFFYAFKGIPFAAPPVGDLRFKDAVPAESWSGVRKGFESPACPQISVAAFFTGEMETVGEEDCLYLHVYTPQPHSETDLPVMVFIHGGGYLVGDAAMFGGSPGYLLKKDIVLVTIQYRLGTLGFLSTGDSVLPGNLGLKDQTFALKWVQDNIREFGGNPDKVTIFGESAGSVSSHFQILTPYSEGLFHRAILQSGSVFSPWAMLSDPAKRAMKIAKTFNCPGTEDASADSTQLLQCFKERSTEELVLAANLDTKMNMPEYMGPRVDGDYIPDHPAHLMNEGRYSKVDLMTGLCQNEAAGIIMPMLVNETMRTQFLEHFSEVAPSLMGFDQEDNSLYLSRRTFYHYVGNIDVTEDNVEVAQQMMADLFMNVGHDETSILHARDAAFGKPTFRYEVQHRPERSFASMMSNYSGNAGKKWVAHADDLLFLFDNVFGQPPVNRTDDMFLRDIMVDLWTNFARTGNPTPDLELGFKWEPMQSVTDLRFLSLTPDPKMTEDNRAENREFWRNMPVRTNKLLFPKRFECAVETCPN